ncbi:unnamed protein product [Psylliodes chrysocephalus]|uniref:Uncharacterized protein n=1 Tax=Psylliodes chrysocephalus TaxID=3402493 RepID=A0A9P0D0P3_9CUCU|nr:unnamed protein product [Psylliodes chrysocephala]
MVTAAELMVHKRRATKFYNKKSVQELNKIYPKVSGIVSDYMQNLPLPLMPVQEMFHLRKLCYYVFNIQDFKTVMSIFYNYPEGECKKGPKEVCTFILDFIEKSVSKKVEILHVFCDAYGGTCTPPTGSIIKVPFTIRKYIHTVFKQAERGYVQYGKYIDSFCVNTFKLSKVDDVPLPSIRAYIERVPIKMNKIENTLKILQYIPEDFLPFFEEKLTWLTAEGDGDGDEEY